MIYLIKSATYTEERGFFFILKIGFTENLKRRFSGYETHNPDCKLIKTIDGNQDYEALIHKKFKKYKYKTEWFEENQEIYDWFDNPLPIISLSKQKQKLSREEFIKYNPDCEKVILDFLEITTFAKSLKFICELYFENREDDINLIFSKVPECLIEKVKSYYTILTPKRCRALGYNITDLNKERVNKIISEKDELTKAVLLEFKEGDRITKAEAKKRLTIIYQSVRYKKTAKASDLEKWFNIGKIKLGIVNGKQLFGIKLISIKQ